MHSQHSQLTRPFLSAGRRGTSLKKCFRSATGSLFFFSCASSSLPVDISSTRTSACIPSSSTSSEGKPDQMCNCFNCMTYLPFTRARFDFFAKLSSSLSSSSTSSTEAEGGRLLVVEVVEVVGMGVSGGGVMLGEYSAALRAASASIAAALRAASTEARAARWEAVAGLAVLLGSAMAVLGFDTRGSRDVAIVDIGGNQVFCVDFCIDSEGQKYYLRYYTVYISHPKPSA